MTELSVIVSLLMKDRLNLWLWQTSCITRVLSHSRGSHIHDILVFTLRIHSRAMSQSSLRQAFPSELSSRGYWNPSPFRSPPQAFFPSPLNWRGLPALMRPVHMAVLKLGCDEAIASSFYPGLVSVLRTLVSVNSGFVSSPQDQVCGAGLCRELGQGQAQASGTSLTHAE